MLRRVNEPNPQITEADVRRFESKHDIVLPECYRQFLLQYNGGRPQPTDFPIRGFANNPFGAVHEMFGISLKNSVYDLDSVLTELEGTVPHGLVPIGCTEGDDFVCLDLRQRGEPVVYWDRRPFWGNNIWKEEYLYPIADSFGDFLEKLEDSPD